MARALVYCGAVRHRSTKGKGKAVETRAVRKHEWATIPNAITIIRFLLVVPIVGYLVADTEPALTAVLLLAFGLSDWVDGFIARKFNQVSHLGVLLDPIADRLGIVAIAIALVINGAIPLWVGLAIFVTDLILLCTYFLLRLGSPPASTWLGKIRTAIMMLGLACVAFGRIPEFSVLATPGVAILTAGTVLHLFVGFGYLRIMRASAKEQGASAS
ncbi:CDP-alcohol phosphatidyltransferase family protein [Glutamicibacter sp.]|uniref:CDP-alcohol phosphatidyltransferase family protein n=1 Tax=Glutamicibacter sp. TaxID=1931995 RepID=UPI003D6B219E